MTRTAMTANMGRTDRTIRLAAAAVLAALALFVVEGALAWVLGVVAVVLTVTSLVRWCPAYLPFGINTCRT